MDDGSCCSIDTDYLAWCSKRFLVSYGLFVVFFNLVNCKFFIFILQEILSIYDNFIRPLAIGALITTITACTLCNIQIVLDTKNNKIDFSQCSTNYNHSKDASFIVKYPNPSFEGYFMAFGSIMFAFGGASTFPTIQADMRDKSKFKFAAYIAMAGKILNY